MYTAATYNMGDSGKTRIAQIIPVTASNATGVNKDQGFMHTSQHW